MIASEKGQTAAENSTILVVEDEPAVREVVRRVLTHSRYRVLVANHAAEAEEILAGETAGIDLLLTDVVMPGRSGPELYASLAADNPSLRVLFMSGYAFEGKLGDAPALSKPFSAAVLLNKVQEILGSPEPATMAA